MLRLFPVFKEIARVGACIGITLFEVGMLIWIGSGAQDNQPMCEVGHALALAALILAALCLTLWY